MLPGFKLPVSSLFAANSTFSMFAESVAAMLTPPETMMSASSSFLPFVSVRATFTSRVRG